MRTTANVGARHLRIRLLLFAWKKLLSGGDVLLVLETVDFDKLIDRCAVFLRNPLQGVPGPDLVIPAAAFAFATAPGRGSGGSLADAR